MEKDLISNSKTMVLPNIIVQDLKSEKSKVILMLLILRKALTSSSTTSLSEIVNNPHF